MSNANIIRLANRFQRILKMADGPEMKVITGALEPYLKPIGVLPFSNILRTKLRKYWQQLNVNAGATPYVDDNNPGDRKAAGWTFNLGFEVDRDGAVTYNVGAYQGDDQYINSIIIPGLNAVITPLIQGAVEKVQGKNQDPAYTRNNWIDQITIPFPGADPSAAEGS